MPFCLNCYEFIVPLRSLCALCTPELESERLPECAPIFVPAACLTPDPRGYRMRAAFHYRGLAQALILNAKGQSCYRSLQFLINNAFEILKPQFAAEHWDYVISAPPSVISRWHCRWDLAAELANTLATNLQVPRLIAPRGLHWRWKKRAAQTDKHWQPSQVTARNYRNNVRWAEADRPPHILLVDDVVTSGFTMATLAAQYQGAHIAIAACATGMQC